LRIAATSGVDASSLAACVDCPCAELVCTAGAIMTVATSKSGAMRIGKPQEQE
jgi:hypothetical protein